MIILLCELVMKSEGIVFAYFGHLNNCQTFCAQICSSRPLLWSCTRAMGRIPVTLTIFNNVACRVGFPVLLPQPIKDFLFWDNVRELEDARTTWECRQCGDHFVFCFSIFVNATVSRT